MKVYNLYINIFITQDTPARFWALLVFRISPSRGFRISARLLDHLSYNLNSSEGGYLWDFIGEYDGGYHAGY